MTEKTGKKKEKNESAKKKSNTQTIENVRKFLNDDRFKFIFGLFLLFFSLFLLLAFISFLFTWQNDQSKLDIARLNFIFDGSIHVDNWAGKLGALFANLFIHKWFGIASFSAVFLLVIYGFQLLRIKLLNNKRAIRLTIVFTIWTSLALGYIFETRWNGNAGGLHGLHVSNWITALLGKAGTGFIILIFLLSIVVFSFDNALDWIKLKFISLFGKKQAVADPDFETSQTNENSNPIKDFDDEEQNAQSEDSGFMVTDLTEKIVEDDDDDFETVEYKPEPKPSKEKDTEENIELTIETEQEEETSDIITTVPEGDYDPTRDLSSYQFPTLDLLVDHKVDNSEVSQEELISNKNRIVETLANYKIQIDKIKATIGPTITLYEIVPAPGIRISKIKNLEDDIALSLSALGIRIIAPIPGKGTIGIEVPNSKPEIVSMRSVISSSKFQESKFALPVALGKTISNETFVFDLAKMPHLLVAGATGQGKSVGLNAILSSLLYKKHPSQLKFVMVDPKKVELSFYSKLSRHFIAQLPDAEEPIITDTHKVVNTLNSLVVEMENRYSMLVKASVRDLKEYNHKFIKRMLNPEKGHKFLPYIVVVIDEFADLIMEVGKEIELPIARIAQKARAVGIHLIIATQRPSTNIITGTIKANFPARIAFKVASMIDSRTILDTPGANQLIGRGDMLFSQASELIRVQCAFIDTPEIENITDFIGQQRGYTTAYELPEYVGEESGSVTDVDLSKKDQLFEEAARLVVIHQQGSTSLIQRKFSIGYNRAGRIMDQLEAAGVVGPFEGSKARQVMFPDEYSLEQFLNRMENGSNS
ncbi:MAG: DNA translocase FtsK 4TM domain-containing protein [Bacteroidales bacterium]|nr:DNA translocase FtsK 4TM domain-containing protein [Bacteroidales bacterium]